MLCRARQRKDIEWIQGDLADIRFDREFDLVVMTGHAFQVLTDDNQIRQGLAGIRSALTLGGRFCFETRNPTASAWRQWTQDRVVEVPDATGRLVRFWHEV